MKITIIILVLALSGCAANQYRPVVDQSSVCQACDYERDLAQCRQISNSNTNLTSGAAVGAALGAGVFAVLGAVVGVDVGSMAAMGAAMGGMQGLGGEARASRDMVARCLSGRGYSVLR